MKKSTLKRYAIYLEADIRRREEINANLRHHLAVLAEDLYQAKHGGKTDHVLLDQAYAGLRSLRQMITANWTLTEVAHDAIMAAIANGIEPTGDRDGDLCCAADCECKR